MKTIAYIFPVVAIFAIAIFAMPTSVHAYDYFDGSGLWDSGFDSGWNSDDYFGGSGLWDSGDSGFCGDCGGGSDWNSGWDYCGDCGGGYSTYNNPGFSNWANSTSWAQNTTDVVNNIHNVNTIDIDLSGYRNHVAQVTNLSASCYPSPSIVNEGESVAWLVSNVSGGNGNYSYSWSGSEGLSGNGSSISKIYNTTGTKTATLTVSSGNKVITVNCGTTFVEKRTDLGGTCRADDRSVDRNESVTWTVDAFGGTGNYTYEWSGSSPLDGRSGRSVDVDYNSTGTKHGSVTIRSGSQSRTIDCGTVRVGNNNNDDFSVSCHASPSRVDEDERVRWIADVNGVNDNDVDFRWSGDASGNDSEVTERYSNSGTYEAKVRATYNGHTETDTCTVRVDNNGGNGNVTLRTGTPTGNLASLNSVYLSQVPYTGATDNMKLAGIVTLFGLLSAWVAYEIVANKAKKDRKSAIANFKAENLASKI